MAGSIFWRTVVAAWLAVTPLALAGKTMGADDLATMQKQEEADLAAHRFAEAETLARQIVAVAESSSTDPRVIGGSHNRLGHVYRAWGRYADAEACYRNALALYEKTFGPTHMLTALTLNYVAETYRLRKRFDQAVSLYTRAAKAASQAPPSLDAALIFANFSFCRQAQGNGAEAERLSRQALAIREKVWGTENRLLLPTLDRLAGLCEAERHYADAERILDRAIKIAEKAWGREHKNVAGWLSRQAKLEIARARDAAAEPLLKRALKIREKALGSDAPAVAQSLEALANLYLDEARYEAA